MNRFLMRLLTVAAAFAAVLLLDTGTAQAAGPCSVPSVMYPTIQSAVIDPTCNPINVAPGVYNEQVTIGRTVTLDGAQAGVDARTRVGAESVIQDPCGPVQIEADNVVLDGFTIQGSILPDPCFLSGIWTNPGFSGTHGGHTIVNNIVQNNISGIELDSDCLYPTLVQHNLIQNNNNPGPGSGNGIQTNFGLCNATIDNNKFSGHLNASMLFVATQSNLTISNNTLVGGTSERIVLANTTTSSITGNVSTGSTSSGTVRLFGGNSNITINGNTLLNGMRGIRVDDPFGIGPNSGVAAHFNCIQGNTLAGLQVDHLGHSGTLHAENNWWGSPTGPTNPNNPGGTGDAVVDPDTVVDFMPFLTSPPAPPCPQPPPPNTPGKVTGGGQVQGDPIFSLTGDLLSLPALIPSLASPTSQATFGFTVTCCAPTGNLQYDDHSMGVRIKAQSISGLFISSSGTSCPATPGSKHARFTGTAAVIRSTGTTNEPFTVNVDDCGEPGSSDTFSINATSYSNGPYTLIGGNIQIH